MNMYVVMSHQLTDNQVQEIYHRFDIKNIVYLPEPLKKVWGNIPPEGEWNPSWLQPVKDWLSEQMNEGDKIIVQGEFGATYALVSWLQTRGFAVYYATSQRRVVETVKGEQVIAQRLFEHVTFRKYPDGGNGC